MRTRTITGTVIAVFIMMTLAACETTTEILTGSYQEEIGDATAADVTIELAFESGTLSALAPGDANLIDADLEYIGEIDFNVSGNRNKTISLSEDTKSRMYTGDETLDWAISLSPDLLIALTLVANSGSMVADLSSLQLTGSDLEVNSGTLIASFPVSDAAIPGSIDVNSGTATLNLPGGSTLAFGETASNSGTLTINVAEGASFSAQELSADSGGIMMNVGENASFALTQIFADSGTIIITLADGVALDSDVSVDSGTVIFEVPYDAAVQVDLRRLQSGELQVPEGYFTPRREGEGIYQNDIFENAETQIILRAEVDSGTLIVREASP